MDNVWRLSISVNGHIENSCRNENYIFNPLLHFAVQGTNMRLHFFMGHTVFSFNFTRFV